MFSLRVPAYPRSTAPLRLLDDGFFTDLFGGVDSAPRTTLPAVDVQEQKDKFVLKADLPGVAEKDIHVEFNEGELTLEAKRVTDEQREEKAPEVDDRIFHLRERSVTNYRRVFTLGDSVDAGKIAASYRDGTLTIEIPKAEKAIPRPIPITVNKG
jgi:HSP20 family protein